MANPNPDSYSTTSRNVYVGSNDPGTPPVSGLTMTGPTSGSLGVASTNYTVGLNPSNGIVAGTVLVSMNDSNGGGNFSPNSFTLNNKNRTATFTYTPTSSGTKIIGLTNNKGLSNPTPISYSVGSTASAITLTGPTSGLVNAASTNFTVAISPVGGVVTGTVVVTPSSNGGGGTFTPTTVSLTTGSPSATFTYTPTTSGSKTISVSNNGGLTNPSSVTYSVAIGAANAITLSGPSFGTVGQASTAYTVGVTPVGGTITGTVTVTPTDSSGNGSFSPATVALTNASPTSTFSYTPSTTGTRTIGVTNNGGLSNPTGLTFSSNAAGSSEPPSTGLTITTIRSPLTGTMPFSFGQPFKQGDVPSGQTLTGVQCTVKNTWPDGSVKFAIISGIASLVANTARPIGMQIGAPPGGTTLTTANLKAALTSPVSIDAGAFGSASWTDTDWDAPFQTWVSGPIMSSWTYRKGIGGDSHLVAWLEVRLWSNGAVEILPWVENAYLTVTGPTIKNAIYTFSMGGSQRFSDYIGFDINVTYAGGTTFTTIYDYRAASFRVRGATSLGTAVWSSYDGNTGLSTYSVTWDSTNPGTVSKLQILGLCNHQRAPLVSGTGVSHWLGTNPDLNVKHEAAYLSSTRFIPYYFATVSPTVTAVTSQPTSFTPLQQGTYPNGMGAGGYSPSIGILPEWDVLYLTCASPNLWKVIQWQGYSAGRYGIHFRDQATNRPVRFSQHPNLVLDLGRTSGVTNSGTSSTNTYTPAATGPTPLPYTNTHSPAMGYLAYLTTGRVYHLETVQFQTTVDYLKQPNVARGGSQGIFVSYIAANTTRGAAWSLRTLAQACAITPDGDILKTEFTNSIEANVNYYHTRYVAQPNNPQGIVTPYSDYTYDVVPPDNKYYEATWMQDFFTAAIGVMKSLKPSLSGTGQTRLNEFFNWKAQSIVNRFGGIGPKEFLYRDASPYVLAIAPSDAPNFDNGTGPWYTDWGQVYNATYAVGGPVDFPGAKEEGPLRGSYFPEATSYWGNTQLALVYAVEHGAPGALTAYTRMTNASNWQQFVDWCNVEPVYGMKPPPELVNLPTWRSGQAVNQWREISNTSIANLPPTNIAYQTNGTPASGGVTNRMDAWCGLSLDTRTNTVYSLANGGHGDYYGNEICTINLLANSPAWREALAGSSGNVVPVGSGPTYTDGKPSSRHSYYGQQVIERHDRALTMGGSTSNGGGASDAVESYNITGNAWDTWVSGAPVYGYAINGSFPAPFVELGWPVCKDPRNEDVYVLDTFNFIRYRPNRIGAGIGWTRTVVSTWPDTPIGSAIEGATAIDTNRNRLLWFRGGGTSAPRQPVTFDIDTGVRTTHTFQASAAQAALDTITNFGSVGASLGMVYIPQLDSYIIKNWDSAGNGLWKVNAGTWAVEFLTTTNASSIPPGVPTGSATGESKLYNRFLHVPSLNGIIYFPRSQANGWFLRLY